MRKRIWRCAVSVIVISGAIAGGYWLYQTWSSKQAQARPRAAEEKPYLVRVAPVERTTFRARLRLTGNVTPRQQATVFSLVPGVVRSLKVKEGDTVKKGQILARLDASKMALGLQQARTGQRLATLKLSQTKTTFERMRTLFRQGAITKSQFDQVETAYRAAELQVKQARTGVWMAGAQFSDAIIRAPIDGVVLKRVVEQGDLMSSAQAMKSSPLLIIADLSVMKVEATVAERDLGRVAVGQRAEVTVVAYPGRRFAGRVTEISQMVDPVARTATVTVEVPNLALPGAAGKRGAPIHPLKAGMFARVTLDVATRPNAVVIPVDALLGSEGAPYVFLLQQGLARRRDVTVGARQEGMAQIVKGLSGGESLIVLGHRLVQDGQRARAATLPPLDEEPPATPVEKR